MHSPHVRLWLSVTGSPMHTKRRTSMPIGQWNEQMLHWTQRLGSGVTHAPASVCCLLTSEWSQILLLMRGIYPCPEPLCLVTLRRPRVTVLRRAASVSL